jgi:hypothetical protein
VESILGKRTFLNIYFLSGRGRIVQILSLWHPAGLGFGGVVGASAGICGLIAAFALLNPQTTIYLFFVSLSARSISPLMIAMTVLFILIPGDDHVAHGAHLGGIPLASLGSSAGTETMCSYHGTVCRTIATLEAAQSRQRKRELVERPRWKFLPPNTGRSESEMPAEEFISKEVNPILDKISAHGIQSLTERERKILEAARKKMAKQ